MKKMLLIMIAVVSCFAVGSVQAEDDMGVTVDASFMTKYLWHGVDLLDDAGAFAPSVNVNIGDTGFYVGTMYIIPAESGTAYGSIPRSDLDHWLYWAGYKSEVMVGETFQTDYDLNYTYNDLGTIRRAGLPKISGGDADVQELSLDMTMTNLGLIGGVIPHYELVYLFEGNGGETGIYGFEHVLGLGYDFTVADTVMNSSIDFVYDDNAVTGDSDWDRMVAGLSAQFELAGGKLVPGIYYQKAFHDGRTGPFIDDDFYATVSYSFSF